LAVSIDKATGLKIDERVWDIRQLEVDEDTLIRGNLEIRGTEIVRLTTIQYADVEIRNGYDLIMYSDDGVTQKVRVDGATGDVSVGGSLIVSAPYSILGRSYAGTAVTVTETVATLKDSAAPVSPKNVLYPLNAVVDASNPTGSTVTLYVEVRLLHSDGTETTIDSFSVAEGATATRDYLSTDIAKGFKDGVSVVAVRLYAYCSATPATGYEPSVTLTSVKAMQF